MRLTEAQSRLVSSIRAGSTLIRSFDVYGGYWWSLRPTYDRVSRTTVEALERSGHIVMGEDIQVHHSGYREAVYALSSEEAGK